MKNVFFGLLDLLVFLFVFSKEIQIQKKKANAS